MKRTAIDPQSPVPLYHQIAESIRARIAAGELAAGDVLEPLREAARVWGVNLHTVRHAYTALAREGLVESRGAGGTRVTGGRPPGAADGTPDIAAFLDRVINEAREVHGLDGKRLAAEIARRGDTSAAARPVVYVVECSADQCNAHAAEINARYDVEAREWSLERLREPPPGCVVATYFHYNDIRRMWPGRLREVRFVTISPDPKIPDRLPAGVEAIYVCEEDAATAETVAADFSTLLEPAGFRVEPLVTNDPGAAVESLGENTLVLAAPRVWSRLDETTRASDRVMTADYVIDPGELKALADEMRWRGRGR
jgi:DNA-binding transcriptional regulator YhcF (GntR family)